MQPYRTARPHDSADCGPCGPSRPGHQLCQHDGCNQLAQAQHRRHATAEEYDALPDALRPIDGIAHQAVYTCYDHEADAICADEHDDPTPDNPLGAAVREMWKDSVGACSTCGAAPDRPCTKANGARRSAPHDDRADAAPVRAMPTCDHVHREDCQGLGTCACRADDPAPNRPKRIIDPVPVPGPPPMHVAVAGPIAEFLAGYGIDMAWVTELTPIPAPDGTMLLHATMIRRDAHGQVIFNQHGWPETTDVEVPFKPLPAALRPMPPDDHATPAV